MKTTQLGEFEELVLLSVGALADDAYGVAIKEFVTEKTNRKPSIGALHSALSRLEDKGFLKAKMGEATKVRGGRRKKYYQITIAGREALKIINQLRGELYSMIPNLSFIGI
jgi:DNA-binding PadR family transcriptional regulator